MPKTSTKSKEFYTVTAATPIVQTDRALRDLRSGIPVVVWNAEVACLCGAVEHLTPERMGQHERGRSIALTAERAAVLGLPSALTRVDASSLSIDTLKALADPLSPHTAPAIESLPIEPFGSLDATCLGLAKLAELLPTMLCSALGVAGEDAARWAWERGFMAVSADAVDAYTETLPKTLMQVSEAAVPIDGAGTFRVLSFRPANGGLEHLALVAGDPGASAAPVPIRLHSSCLTGDILGSLKCDCGEQLRKAIHEIGKAGCGVVLYLNQEGRGIGIANKLKAYQLQDQGSDTFDANEMLGYAADERQFGIAAEILRLLDIRNVRLMTNNPHKIAQLESFGVTVERVAHHVEANDINKAYLTAKRVKGGHLGE